MTARRARGAVPRSGRRLGALHAAAICDAILHPRAAADVRAFLPEHPAQERAAPGAGAPPGACLGLGWRGRCEEGPREVAAPAVVVVASRQVPRQALLDGRSRQAFGHAVPVRLVGARRADVGAVIRAMRLLEMGPPRRARAHPRHPAPPEVPRGAPVSRRDISLGQQAAAEPHRTLRRVDGIVLGLAPVDGLHRAHGAQDARHTRAGAAVSPPVPGEAACDTDHEVLPGGRKRLQKRFRPGRHMLGEPDRSILVQHAQEQATSLSVKTTVNLVRLGVESPEVSS